MSSPFDRASLLALGLRGFVILPGDAGYDASRSVWNGMIDRRPAAILRCVGTADIMAAVRYARANQLEISIKGGGHNIAGLAVSDGSLLLDLSSMRGVVVDPSARRAQVQPGCLLGDLDRETQLHGLAAVMGFVSNTGVAGLTLGGGFGYLTRRFGWSSDHLRSVDLVTAEGELVRVSEDEHPDLFWALRGGGGNFGVVTRFEYDLHPVGPEIVGGLIAWSADQAPEVLAMYRELMASAEPELTITGVLRVAPPVPWLPQELHGRPMVGLLVCHTGPVEEAEARLAPIKRFGKPAGDVVTRRSYVSIQSLLDATQPNGRRYYWKSEYLPSIDQSFLDQGIECMREIASPYSALLIFPIDGPLNRLDDAHSAVGNRDAHAVFNLAGAWDDPLEDAKQIAWVREQWRALRPFSTGGTYVNFLNEDDGQDRLRAAYGKNHARLAEVKRAWDPTNMFRRNQNIAP